MELFHVILKFWTARTEPNFKLGESEILTQEVVEIIWNFMLICFSESTPI